MRRWRPAQAALETAEAANRSGPSEDTANRFREAEANADSATKALEQARVDLEAAQGALKAVSGK